MERRFSACPLLTRELLEDEPGQHVVLDRLLDLPLVAVLRAWLARSEADVPAWYSARNDPVIGPAPRLLQNNPAYAWTVAALADATHVSRAALARRFTEPLVGRPWHSWRAGAWRWQPTVFGLSYSRSAISAFPESLRDESRHLTFTVGQLGKRWLRPDFSTDVAEVLGRARGNGRTEHRVPPRHAACMHRKAVASMCANVVFAFVPWTPCKEFDSSHSSAVGPERSRLVGAVANLKVAAKPRSDENSGLRNCPCDG